MRYYIVPTAKEISCSVQSYEVNSGTSLPRETKTTKTAKSSLQ